MHRAPPAPTVEDVVVATGAAFGITPKQISADNRGHRESRARYVAMWIAKEALELSVGEIAEAFGRHYNATLRGLERAEIALRSDNSAREQAIAACDRLGLPEVANGLRVVVPGGEDGLVEVHPDLAIAFYNSMATAQSANAIDAVYNTGFRFFRDFGDSLETALFEHGCEIRIILTHPESELLGADPSLCLFLDKPAMRDQLYASLTWFHGLQERLRRAEGDHGALEVRLQAAPPPCGLLLLDGQRALVTQYLPFTASRPTYEYLRTPSGGIFRHIEEGFDRLWANARPVDWQSLFPAT